MRIGIFDSGVGGLTVLKEMVDNYPDNEYIYVGDTLNVPYGNKSMDELKNLSSKIVDYLVSKNVDKIIIACGTVSSNISEYLKNKYKIPIIDIISPTIDYIQKKHYKKIGIIATSMTIKSNIFNKKLTNINVISIECPKLVPAIENYNYDQISICLNEYLSYFKDNKVDLIVLGCTHYPIVKNNIKEYLDYDVRLLNMAEPIVDIFSNVKNTKSSFELNFSKLDSRVIRNVEMILENHIDYNIKEINLK